ncbi:MAG: hypothetical protein AAGG72_01085 [Pseudomonadota bacterium]
MSATVQDPMTGPLSTAGQGKPPMPRFVTAGYPARPSQEVGTPAVAHRVNATRGGPASNLQPTLDGYVPAEQQNCLYADGMVQQRPDDRFGAKRSNRGRWLLLSTLTALVGVGAYLVLPQAGAQTQASLADNQAIRPAPAQTTQRGVERFAGGKWGNSSAMPRRAPQAQPTLEHLLASSPATLRTRDMFLARSTLIALEQAIRTRNLSVLYDLTAPAFQRRNPPDRLAQIFSVLAKQSVDLSHAAVARITLSPEAPPQVVRPNSRQQPLRVAGQFNTPKGDVRFDLRFHAHAGLWRLVGIAVAPVA